MTLHFHVSQMQIDCGDYLEMSNYHTKAGRSLNGKWLVSEINQLSSQIYSVRLVQESSATRSEPLLFESESARARMESVLRSVHG